MDVVVLNDDGPNVFGFVGADPVADLSEAEGPATRRRWRGFAAGAGLVLLLIVVTVTALGWNEAKGRSDLLAARLASTRAELTKLQSEASNLSKEVGNLKEDKKVLNTWVEKLQSEKDGLRLSNEDLASTNEAISTVVQRLNQCLIETEEIGAQLFRNPQSVPEARM